LVGQKLETEKKSIKDNFEDSPGRQKKKEQRSMNRKKQAMKKKEERRRLKEQQQRRQQNLSDSSDDDFQSSEWQIASTTANPDIVSSSDGSNGDEVSTDDSEDSLQSVDDSDIEEEKGSSSEEELQQADDNQSEDQDESDDLSPYDGGNNSDVGSSNDEEDSDDDDDSDDNSDGSGSSSSEKGESDSSSANDLEDLFSSSDDEDDDSDDDFLGFNKSNMVKVDKSILVSLSSDSDSDIEDFKSPKKSSPKKKIENLKINLKDLKRKRKVDIKIKSPSPKKQRVSARTPKQTSPMKALMTERQKQQKAREMAREVKSTDFKKTTPKMKPKKIVKPTSERKPQTSYMLWAGQMRKEVTAKFPGCTFGEISTKLGKMWKGFSDQQKKVWKYKSSALKEVHQQQQNTTNISQGAGKKKPVFSRMIETGPKKVKRTPAQNRPSMITQQQKVSSKKANLVANFGENPPHRNPEDALMKELAKQPLPGTEPLDAACHLDIMSEHLGKIADVVRSGYKHQTNIVDELADAVLCSIVPMLSLTKQVPELAGCISDEVLAGCYANLAESMPRE